MRGIEKPTQLRLWGFVLTVGGGAAIGVGSLLPWVSVGLRSDTAGVLTSTTPGVDLRAGKVCLAIGIVVLLAIVALRMVHSTKLRRLIAAGMIVLGLGAGIIGIFEISGAQDRFLFTGIRPLVEHFHEELGLPPNSQLAAKVKEQLRKEGFANVKLGLPLTIAGGAIVVIGGLLDFAWAGARRREREAERSEGA